MGRPSVLTNEERLLKKVAHKRFHKLLHVRIARRMVPLLGQEKWAGIVKDAQAFGKPLYVPAFKPGNLWCRGRVTGWGCPYDLGTRVGTE